MLKNENIIYFMSNDWSDIWGRQQQIISLLSKQNKVLVIETLGLVKRLPNKIDYLRILKRFFNRIKGIRKINKNLFIYSPILLPYFQNKFIRVVNKFIIKINLNQLINKFKLNNHIFWTSLPSAIIRDLIIDLKPEFAIYDCADDFSGFKGAPQDLSKTEQKIAEFVNIVFVTTKKLYDDKITYNSNTYYIPNGADLKLFNPENKSNIVPPDIKNINPPIIGFIGSIDFWVDLELLNYVAKERPDWSMVIIGPVFTDNLRNILKQGNIYYLGPKEYTSLPNYIKWFAVCLLPFKQIKYMEYADPIIMYNYLAMGKPVVSTDFPAVRQIKEGIIKISSHKEEFLKFIAESLYLKDKELSQQRRQIALNNSWISRIDIMSNIISNKIQN